MSGHDPHRALSIVERYEGALNYLYPILLNVSHKHRVLRDETLRVTLAQIGLFQQGLNFLGYRIWPTHKLLRRSSVARAKKTIKRLQGQPDKLCKFIASWRGHAQWADSHNLLHALEVYV